MRTTPDGGVLCVYSLTVSVLYWRNYRSGHCFVCGICCTQPIYNSVLYGVQSQTVVHNADIGHYIHNLLCPSCGIHLVSMVSEAVSIAMATVV